MNWPRAELNKYEEEKEQTKKAKKTCLCGRLVDKFELRGGVGDGGYVAVVD